VRARFQNVYGPGEILGAGQWRGTPATVWRNVTPTFIYKALHKDALPLEGSGRTTRDFIYVEDIVQGLLLCARRGVPGEVYNLASGVETSIHDLALLINRLTGNPTPVLMKPARDWDHSGKRFGSIVKSRRELGFEAKTELAAGLEKTVEWTRQNLALIDACIARHADHLQSYGDSH
jgi:nucleoside-diphosphate-sugar epimerase